MFYQAQHLSWPLKGSHESSCELTARRFKDRLYEHNTNMNNESGRTETALSAHIWRLKDQNKQYKISWKIRCKGSDYNPRTKKCRICLREKHYIMYDRAGCTLNKRSEVFNTCRHKRMKLLENVKTWDMYGTFFDIFQLGMETTLTFNSKCISRTGIGRTKTCPPYTSFSLAYTKNGVRPYNSFGIGYTKIGIR